MKKLILIILIYNTSNNLFSQFAKLDTSFNRIGIDTFKLKYSGSVYANDYRFVILQKDKKIIVGGAGNKSDSELSAVLTRYQLDGTKDSSFGINGIFSHKYNNYNSNKALDGTFQSDGKIILSGSCGSGLGLISRLTINGKIDSSFGISGYRTFNFNTGRNSEFIKVKTDIQDRIIALCSSENITRSSIILTRFRKDGLNDSTFGVNGIVAININNSGTIFDKGLDFIIQPDGKILVTGFHINNLTGASESILLRFMANGANDFSFGNNSFTLFKSDNAILTSYGVHLDNNYIYTSTQIDDFIDTGRISLIRYSLNGKIDSSFGINGQIIYDYEDSINFEQLLSSYYSISEKKIYLLAVNTYSGNYDKSMLVRINLDGTKDISFGKNGKIILDFGSNYFYGNQLAQQYDNKIVLTGNFSDQSKAIFKFATIRLTNDILQANFTNSKFNTSKDSIFATNTSTGNIASYLWYVKKGATKTNLDTGVGANHDLKYKISSLASFDSVCLEVTSTTGQKNSKCQLLKYTNSGISSSESNFIIDVFPNPISKNLNIKFDIEKSDYVSINIIDLRGRIVEKIKENELIKAGYFELNHSFKIRLDSGKYILQLQSDKINYSKAIMVE